MFAMVAHERSTKWATSVTVCLFPCPHVGGNGTLIPRHFHEHTGEAAKARDPRKHQSRTNKTRKHEETWRNSDSQRRSYNKHRARAHLNLSMELQPLGRGPLGGRGGQ